MRRSIGSLVLVTMCGFLATACHAPNAVPQAAPSSTASDPRQYCWWAVLRTIRSPDSVAARFQKAYQELGFTSASLATSGDTAWSHAPAMELPNRRTRALYESNLVAYRHGDSTHFRYYVTIATPLEGWANTEDSTKAVDGSVDFCAEIARRAAVGWTAPRSPTGEETLQLWTSIH